MAHLYKESRKCECGYVTKDRSNWRMHTKTCKTFAANTTCHQNTVIEILQKELQDNKQHYQKELAAKDRQIEELIKAAKRPRTVNNTNNNRYVVEQHINVFGQESLEHITPEQIQMLLADPESAVARLVKLKHRKEPRNANVRCPNMNRAIYQVVVKDGEEKEWESRAKGEVLEKLYDDNSCMLEAEADEEEHTPFLSHQDKVKASAAANAADGGRCYKEQLDKIHHMIMQ